METFTPNCTVVLNSKIGKSIRGFLHSCWNGTAQVIIPLGMGDDGPMKLTAMPFMTTDIIPDADLTQVASVEPSAKNLNTEPCDLYSIPVACAKWYKEPLCKFNS